jgi:multidrug transporter EmrE-like cation transporter
MSSNPLLGIFFYSAILTAGQGLFKLAAQHSRTLNQPPLAYAIHLFSMPVFLGACLLYALSTVLWVGLLTRLPLSQAYPLVIALSILLTAGLGITIFKEQLTADKIHGLLLVAAGAKFLSRSLQ